MNFSEFITEALTNFKSNHTLNTSSIDDDNIVGAMRVYANATGTPFAEVKRKVEQGIAETQAATVGSKNHKNVYDNAAASEVFSLLETIPVADMDLSGYGITDTDDLLDRDYFFDLTQYVLGENSQFFPLKNPFESRSVKPYFYIYPDHEFLMKSPSLKAAAAQCKTAFCTTKAEMVFSRPFTESLAVNALVAGIKPDSKKYVNQGGPIPDHYCYLEFVIMHELLH